MYMLFLPFIFLSTFFFPLFLLASRLLFPMLLFLFRSRFTRTPTSIPFLALSSYPWFPSHYVLFIHGRDRFPSIAQSLCCTPIVSSPSPATPGSRAVTFHPSMDIFASPSAPIPFPVHLLFHQEGMKRPLATITF